MTEMSGMAPKPSPVPYDVRRRFARHRLDVRLQVNVFRSGETTSLWGRSHEIGADGIGGTLTGELQPGEVVTLEIQLPLMASPLKVRALVRYRDGLRHGFEFLALTGEQHDSVSRVCEMLAAGE